MHEAVKSSLVLTLVCACTCGLLALGNAVTKEKIAATEAEAFQTRLTKNFGEHLYQTLPLSYDGISQIITDRQGQFIFEIFSDGYEKNSQHLLIGLNAEGAVTKICVVSITDSPTQAEKVQEDAFLSQFYGVSDSSDAYDAVSGATKSSGGIHSAVKLALDTFHIHREEIKNG